MHRRNRLRRAGVALAALALLTGGAALSGATPASAAAVDYDCDQLRPLGDQAVVVAGEGCAPRSGDPEEDTRVWEFSTGQHYACEHVGVQGSDLVGIACRDLSEDDEGSGAAAAG